MPYGGCPVVPDPMDLVLKVLLVIGSNSVNGFDGWVDADIAWRHDWHQQTNDLAYHFSKTG